MNENPFFVVKFNSNLASGFLYKRYLHDVIDAMIMTGGMSIILYVMFRFMVWFFYRHQADLYLIELFNEEDAITFHGDHREVEKRLLHIKTCNFQWMYWLAKTIPCWKNLCGCTGYYDKYYQECVDFINDSVDYINELLCC